MQKITAIEANCTAIRTLFDNEDHSEYGTEFTIQIYMARNSHLSLNEIAKLIEAGDSKFTIVKEV